MPIIPLEFWASTTVQAIAPRVTYNGPMPARPRDYYALIEPTYARRFVYILASGTAALYVGMSWQPGNRFDKHRYKKDWWWQVTDLVLLQVDGADDREAQACTTRLERLAIRKLRPAHNIAGVAV